MTTPFEVTDKQVINWMEATYHRSKSIPSPQDILEAFPKYFNNSLSSAQSFLNKSSTIASLKSRGMERNPNSLTDTQVAAILTVSNLADRRSTTTKLKALGVTTTQWAAWKKNANFKAFFHSQMSEDLDSSVDIVFNGLRTAMDKGDPRAIQLYLELTGRQPTENERNFKLAITRLVESITRHVKDPAVIRAISHDFELIQQNLDPLAPTPTQAQLQINEASYDEPESTEPTRIQERSLWTS